MGCTGGSLVKNGTGTLTLAGDNTYSGSTTVKAGTLSLSNSNALGSGTLALQNGTILLLNGNGLNVGNAATVSGDPTFNVLTGNSDTYSGNISNGAGGPGTVTVNSNGALYTGTLTLSGNNSYTGGTVVENGTLQAGSTTALGNGNLTVGDTNTVTSATLDLNGFSLSVGALNGNTNGTITNNNSAANNPATLTVSGGGEFDGLVQNGSTNTTALTTTGNTLTLTNANTYSGGTTINGGATVQATNSSAGTSSSIGIGTLTFNGGTLQEQAGVGALSFNNAVTVNTTGGTFDANGNTLTWTGVIADSGVGPGALTVNDTAGGGTLVLSAANTYSGGTTLSGGTLQVGIGTAYKTPGDPTSGIASSAIGTGTLTLDGGTLQAGGSFTVANAAQINTTGGTIDANGNSFTYSGAIGNGNGTTGGLTIISSVGGGTVTLTNGNNSYTGATTIGDGTNNVTLALSGSGTIAQSSGVFIASGGTFDISAVTSPLSQLPPAAPAFVGTTINGLQDAGAVNANTSTVNLGAKTLLINQQANTTFSGAIIDGGPGQSGSLIVAGNTGTLTLAGKSTYSGVTIVAGSGVALAGGVQNAFSSNSAVYLADSGTLDLGGFGQTIKSLSRWLCDSAQCGNWHSNE